MSKLIAIDASPNTQTEDVFLALKLLLSPFSWSGSKYSRQLESYFQENYHPEVSFITKSGRAALYLLLSSAIKKGDEVITQAFTCLAVPNAIAWAGGKVIFADIEKDTYNMNPKDLKKKITKKTKAVIIQHTFGIPSNIKEIQKICRENNLFLIEDCAHSLGTKYDSKLVGTFGDGAIFSFNQDKIVSGVNGGALIINNRKLAEGFKKKSIKLIEPSAWETFKTLLHPLLWSAATPTYETFYIGKLLVKIGWLVGILKNTITPAENIGKLPKELLETLSEPQIQLILQGLNRVETDNKRRRKIATRYKKELGKLVFHSEEPTSTEPAYLRYPIQVEDPQALIQEARRYGIILGRWYMTPIFPYTEIAKEYYNAGGVSSSAYVRSSCSVAEDVGKHIVNLPTYPRLTDEEVGKVIKSVKEYYENS